jgi:hypothetical protein
MVSSKRPRGLLVLLVFFCWLDARSLGWLVFPAKSAGYHFWAALGRPWVHFGLETLTVALAATATGYLWRPKAGWPLASGMALGVLAAQSVWGVWFMGRHVAVAKEAYLAGRAARGLPVSPERAAELFSPATLQYSALGLLALLALLGWFTWRHRHYVTPREATT